MLDQFKLAQDAFNMSKDYWVKTMEMMSNFQDHYTEMWNTMMEQGLISQQKGQEMINEWTTRTRQAQQDFMRTVQENMKKAESAFNTPPKSGK